MSLPKRYEIDLKKVSKLRLIFRISSNRTEKSQVKMPLIMLTSQ